MAWDALEFVHVEAEFLELGGGAIWERVEEACWARLEREKIESREASREFRSRAFGRAYHRHYQRQMRVRHKKQDAAVRCCGVCRRMFLLSRMQHLDGTRFCSPKCAARYRYDKRGGNIRPRQMLVVNGKRVSLIDAARRAGLHVSTVRARLRAGMAAEKALALPLIPQSERDHRKASDRRAVRITLKGKTRKLGEWLEQFGISASTYRARIRQGMSPEQALSPRRPTSAPRLVTIGGVTKSLTEWASERGMSVTGVYWRMRKGMDPVRALTRGVA